MVLSCSVMVLASTKAALTVSARAWPMMVIDASIASITAANCARLIRTHQACVEKHEARSEVNTRCEAEGGTLIVNEGANELVCLTRKVEQ